MALESSTLYSANIPVSSEEPDERKQALIQALQEVLVKVSGDSGIATEAALADKLGSPGAYVQGFSYEEISTTDAPSDSQPNLELRVRFSQKEIKALLAKAGGSAWKENQRPVVLVWLVFENETGKQLVTTDSTTVFPALLNTNSLRRGIPFILPQMDLEDLKNVSLQDVWNVNLSVLQNEASRYHTNAMLIGRVSQANGSWQGLWTLLTGTERKDWITRGMADSKMIAPAIDTVADVLVKQSTLQDSNVLNASENQGNTLLMTVSNVKSVTEYTKVIAYLQSISIISQVDALHVLPNQIVFSLTLKGSQDSLLKALAAGHALRPVKTLKIASKNNAGLNYQWIR
jgi:hypothetical protein